MCLATSAMTVRIDGLYGSLPIDSRRGGRAPDVRACIMALGLRRQDRGQLHAKLVVADAERVFVTSANSTRAAWDDNIELGVLIRDPALAGDCIAHLRSLIAHRDLVRLPGSQRSEEKERPYSRLRRLIGKLRSSFAD